MARAARLAGRLCGRGWRGQPGSARRGVFIVGDPKQSIYRFRRAEPRVFEKAREFVVEALGGDALACDHTRRNAPELLAPLNVVFSQAEAAGEFSGFRAHTTELPSTMDAGMFMLPRVSRPPRAARVAASTVWRDSLTTPRHEPDEILREREAALVARAAHGLVASGELRAGEIFILSRKRESLRLVGDALRHVNLPYASVEDTPLMEAPEARDLVAMLDALASPSHRLSLAHALRSPLFGATDDDLIALALRAPDGELVGRVDARRLSVQSAHAARTSLAAAMARSGNATSAARSAGSHRSRGRSSRTCRGDRPAGAA